jgi:hypothetical protein
MCGHRGVQRRFQRGKLAEEVGSVFHEKNMSLGVRLQTGVGDDDTNIRSCHLTQQGIYRYRPWRPRLMICTRWLSRLHIWHCMHPQAARESSARNEAQSAQGGH